MGLDSVELVIAFEEAFGIAIEDSDAATMFTPCDVIDYIERRRGTGTKRLCLTRRAFYRVRERMMEIGIERSAIRLGTPLAPLFPESTRRELWMRARGPISVHQWPDLIRPETLRNTIAVLSLFVAVTVFVSSFHAASSRGILDSFLLAALSAAGASLLLLRITRSQCRHFPGITIVRDLTIRVTVGGAASLLWKDEEFTRATIAATVRKIVIEQLGIEEADYAEKKHFIRDFGME